MSSQRPDHNNPGFHSAFGGTRRVNPDDSLESMRERMQRDREAFFNRDGSSGGGGGGGQPGSNEGFSFFNRAAPRFDFNRDRPSSASSEFRTPRPFPDRFSDMGNFPGEGNDMRKKKSSTNSDDGSVCGNSSAFDKTDSIPIKVVHAKPKYEGGNHTTQLPVRPPPSYESQASPRLERSHSEPPKTFSQKLNRAAPQNPYSTIPENAPDDHPPLSTSRVYLNNPNSNLYTSASSPSVPSNRSERGSTSQPLPTVPPRRSTTQHHQEPPGSRKQSSEAETKAEPAVRHIPIMVEGRAEPVYNRKVSDGPGSRKASEEMGKKPSDFYPQNTKRVQRNHKLDVNPKQAMDQEPTSPLSPPPGPIPMGFTPAEGPPKPEEPTSPQPIPAGVAIPMPCSANFMQEKVSQEPTDEQVDGAQQQHDEVPAAQAGAAADPSMEKLHKVRDDVKELSARIAAFKGQKTDKEYLYLDEMLTRHLVTLDCIESNGRDDIRQMRKDAIKSINRCLSTLDANSSKDAIDNAKVIDELVAKSQQPQ